MIAGSCIGQLFNQPDNSSAELKQPFLGIVGSLGFFLHSCTLRRKRSFAHSLHVQSSTFDVQRSKFDVRRWTFNVQRSLKCFPNVKIDPFPLFSPGIIHDEAPGWPPKTWISAQPRRWGGDCRPRTRSALAPVPRFRQKRPSLTFSRTASGIPLGWRGRDCGPSQGRGRNDAQNIKRVSLGPGFMAKPFSFEPHRGKKVVIFPAAGTPIFFPF